MRALTRDERLRLDAAFDRLLQAPPAERGPLFRELTGESLDELDGPGEPSSAFAVELRALLRLEASDAASLDESAVSFATDLLAWAENREMGTGALVGPWRIVSTLGRGGMGTVFLAERIDPDVPLRVALKVVRRGMDTDDLLLRFRQERRILASLRHPDIARLVDGGVTDDGRPWLAMEYVEGRPLDRWIRDTDPPRTVRIELLARVCEAVDHAHRRLVLHRDLKPANILVTEQGEPRLLDFGIAKLLLDEPEHSGPTEPVTREGRRLLTPEWASPEQLAGEPLSTASDVYQLGLLLRLVLDEGVSGTPRDLRLVLGRALEEDPARRYATAAEVAEELRRFLSSRPVLARAPSMGYRMRRFAARHPVPLAAGAALLLVSGVFAVVHTRGIAAERDLARIEANRAQVSLRFLTALFEGADPNSSGGDTLNVFELLERGSDRVEEFLVAEPDLRVEVQGVLGRIQTELGAFDRAEELLVRRVDAAPDASTEALSDLAQLRTRQGRFSEAEELLARARDASLPGPRATSSAWETHLRILVQRGGNLVYAGDAPAAETELRRALELLEARPDLSPAARETLRSEARMRLGSVLMLDGRYVDAEVLLREEVEHRRSALGGESLALADVLNNLGNLLQRDARADEAEAVHQEALSIRRARLAPDHPDISLSLNNLATVASGRGDPAAAAKLLRESLDIVEARSGRENRNFALSLLNLGWVHLPMGRPDQAEILTREALDILVRVAGPESPDTGLAWGNLGQALLEQNRLVEAEAAVREAKRVRRISNGETSMHAAWRADHLGVVLSRSGRHAEAEAEYVESLRIRRMHFPDTHREVLTGVRRLGDHHIAVGAWEAGARLLAEGLRAMQASPDGHEERIRIFRERLDVARSQAEAAGTPLPADLLF